MSRFNEIVTKFGPRLQRDLQISTALSAGVFGNGDVESAGFATLQEIAPTVAGSRGGFGWMQWTGPRRRAYEAWAIHNRLNDTSDEANYGFMVYELQTTEAAALRALRTATTPEAAAIIVCNKYLRPGVPHLDRRIASAKRAYALLQGAPAPTAMPAPRAAAPRSPVPAEPPAPAAPRSGWSGLWAKLTGKAEVSRPGLKPGGSPELWDVQKVLRDKAYYTKGFLDGLDGGLTQGAVAQARKDNGLGDGGIDADFMAILVTMPRRPVKRANVTITEAAEHAPELFTPPKWLISAGFGSLGLGGASGAGLMDNVQGAVGKANDVFGSVQTAVGYVATVVGFVVEHKTLFLVAAGALLVWKGVSALLSAWIKVKQAFF